MKRCLALCVLLLAACSSGGNLLERPDLAAWRDAVEDTGRDVRRDPGREATSWDDGAVDESPDPGTTDDAFDAAPDDPGTVDEAPADPGTPDPGPQDPGHDPGPVAAAVKLVTDKAALSTAVALINGAKTSVQMVELEFVTGWAPDQVGVALAAAVKRGVDVTVLLESEVEDNAVRLGVLQSTGVDAKLDTSSKTLHTKLIVADRAKAMVGSSNLSISALNYNHEANLSLEGAALVEPLADYADALWANQGSAVRVPTSTVSGFTPMGDGQYPEVVLPRIAAAKTRAWLLLYDFGDDWTGDIFDLAQALIDAKGRGVDVRVILEVGSYADVEASNRASGPRLAAEGIQVRYDPTGTVTHAKMLLLDDGVAVYSGNWVYSGLNTNHEAGGFADLPAVAAQAATYFDQIWKESTP